jgi:hypothetical protein
LIIGVELFFLVQIYEQTTKKNKDKS